MKKYKLGRIAGLNLSARPAAIYGSILLFLSLTGVFVGILRLSIMQAVVGGIAGVVIHWFSAILHQIGHAWAAHRTGYPMQGIRFGSMGLLATSLYPPEEPAFPAKIHVRRALGGPSASLVASLLAFGTVIMLRNVGPLPWWLALFLFLDNLLVFALGSFLPLGFTDGSTLLRWRGRR